MSRYWSINWVLIFKSLIYNCLSDVPIYFMTAEDCAVNCGGKNLPRDFYQLSYGGMYFGLLRSNTLTQFCNYYHLEQDCLTRCPSSDRKTYALVVLQPFEYVCSSAKAIHENFMCIMEHQNTTLRICERVCGKLDKLKEAQAQLHRHEKKKSLKDEIRITNALARICGLTSCHSSCAARELTELCHSREIGYFITNYTRLSVNSSRNVLELSGVSYLFPSTCIRITLGLLGTRDERPPFPPVIETSSEIQQQALPINHTDYCSLVNRHLIVITLMYCLLMYLYRN